MNMHYQEIRKFYDENVLFYSDVEEVRKILKDFLAGRKRSNVLVVDIEATSVSPWNGMEPLYSHGQKKVVGEFKGAVPFSIQLGLFDEKEEYLYCLFILTEEETLMPLVRALLTDPRLLKIGHNIKYDIQVLRKSEIDVDFSNMYDTLSATRLTHDRAESHKLKHLGNVFSGLDKEHADRWELGVANWLRNARSTYTRNGYRKNYVNYSFVPLDIMVEYALKDIWYAFLLYILTEDEVYSNYGHLLKIEHDTIRLAMEMENNGVRIDRPRCLQAIENLTKLIHKQEKAIDKSVRLTMPNGCNIGSHLQLKNLLLEAGVTRADMTVRGKLTSDADTLEKLAIKYKGRKELAFIPLTIENRKCHKLRDTYFQTFVDRTEDEDLIHGNIKPGDTATRRYAMVDPNLQNIPRPIFEFDKEGNPVPTYLEKAGIPNVRAVFIPEVGYTNFYHDYAQIELVVFAIFCQEESMLDAILHGRDLHAETALMMFGSECLDKNGEVLKSYRQWAKVINFGIIYGMGIDKLAVSLGVSYSKAKELMHRYFNKFPNIKRLLSRAKRRLHELGYAEDMFGYRYHIPMDRSYIVVNSLVQGASAAVLKLAILQTRNLIRITGTKAKQLLVIHDEQITSVKHVGLRSNQNIFAYMIKLAMEEILPILQYGIKTRVEATYAEGSWERKKKLEVTPQEIKKAELMFKKVYKDVVLDYNIQKVGWFLGDED